MEITRDPPPLWPQLTNTAPRRRPPSPLFNLPLLIILLPIIALILLSFVVPPFLSVTAQILKPIGIKKSWDSLNVFLVLFAIICGVLARRNDDDDTINNGNVIRNESNDSIRSDNRNVYDDGGAPINVRPLPATSVRRLKRSSSSYPDLRQDSLWENNNEDRFRFFDDFEINKYRSSLSYNDRVHDLRRSWRTEFEELEPKVIPVDTFVLRSSQSKSPAPSTPPPPPPPPPATTRHKPRRRTYQAVGVEQKDKNDRVEYNEIRSPSVTPPPPPPPPPRRPPSPLVSVGNRSEQKYTKLQRRKSNATKEIKMVFASLRKRKKKHKSKDCDQEDCPLQSPTEPPPYYSSTIPPPSPAPPPPPPPPPPSSVFQKYNLFRKGSKSKKIHSVPAPPPPPPPPATFSFSERSSKQSTQMIPPTPPPPPQRRRATANNGKPPLPTKANTANYYDENVNSGGQSPLIPMPPPPPPPPFKMSDFKFVIRGDFVNIRSSPSSRCSSPDLEEVDVSSSKYETETVSIMDGDDHGVGVAAVPVYCPSPDVNAKAETFIARLRDGWKMEKINSLREKQSI